MLLIATHHLEWLFWNPLCPFRVAAAQCKKICPERLNWPGRLAEPFLSTLQKVNFCQASNIFACWLQFFASWRIITPCKKFWVWLLVFTKLVKNSSWLAFFEIFCTNTKKKVPAKAAKNGSLQHAKIYLQPAQIKLHPDENFQQCAKI